MQLIKISASKVNIHTDASRLGNIKINDLLMLHDATASIVCIVTSLTGHETYDLKDELNAMGDFDIDTEQSNIIEASIIGSLKDGMFSKSVDTYPTIDVKIEKIDSARFTEMLAGSHEAGFQIGTYAAYDERAYINGNRFFQRHSSIVGNSGSGKSYCVASLLEKISALGGANVILFDLHGEYKDLSFVETVKIGDGGLAFPLWFLSFKDIYSFFLKMKEDNATLQIAALRRAFYEARRNEASESLPVTFNIKELLFTLIRKNEEEVTTGEYYKTGDKAGVAKTVKGDMNGKLSSVISIIEDKLIDSHYNFMTADHPQSYLNYFIGKIYGNHSSGVKVIDLSDVPHDMLPIVVGIITKLIYQVQLQQDKGAIHPVNVICEEAHAYIPASDFGLSASQRRLLEIFETIAKEGRKFGITLTIVSQRPGELNKTIMAQVENYIVLKMTNETDRQYIKSILPESSRAVMDMLPLFSPGDCFTIGDASSIIFKTRIDAPAEPPMSSTIDVWNAWARKSDIDVDSLVHKIFE